jgi:hypothetical protein
VVSYFLLFVQAKWSFQMLEHTLACKAPMVVTSKKFQIPKEVQTPKAILRKSENSYNPVCSKECFPFSTIQSNPFDDQVWLCQREASANGVLKHLQGWSCYVNLCVIKPTSVSKTSKCQVCGQSKSKVLFINMKSVLNSWLSSKSNCLSKAWVLGEELRPMNLMSFNNLCVKSSE